MIAASVNNSYSLLFTDKARNLGMNKKPQYPSDKQDQFMVRLPEGMRDSLKEAAEQNRRSMNAEIVARLQEYPRLFALQPLLAFATSERERLQAELEAKQNELDDAKSAAQNQHPELWDGMMSLLTQVREHQKEDDKKLAEVREIGMYLRGDALCLNAELSNEIWKPSAVRPTLETSVARDLAEAIDQRSWALVKATGKTAQNAREHEASAILARHLRHQVLGDSLTDDVLVAFLKEVDGLATPLHAADFYDKVSEMIRDAPDEMRPAYQAALDAVMPKLFKGWPDDWY